MFPQMARFPPFYVNIPVCVCVCVCIEREHIFFFHSSIDGYLGCFHVLAVVKLNIRLHIYLFKFVFSFSSDKYLEVELLDHRVALFLIFLRNLHTVFHRGCASLLSHQHT